MLTFIKEGQSSFKSKKVLFLILSGLIILLGVAAWLGTYLLIHIEFPELSFVEIIFSKEFYIVFFLSGLLIVFVTNRYQKYNQLSKRVETEVGLSNQGLTVGNKLIDSSLIVGIYLGKSDEVPAIRIVTDKQRTDILYSEEISSNQAMIQQVREWAESQQIRMEQNFVM